MKWNAVVKRKHESMSVSRSYVFIFRSSAGILHTQVLLFYLSYTFSVVSLFKCEGLWLNALWILWFHKESKTVSMQFLMTPFFSVLLISRFPVVSVSHLIGWYPCLWRSIHEARSYRMYLYSNIKTFFYIFRSHVNLKQAGIKLRINAEYFKIHIHNI